MSTSLGWKMENIVLTLHPQFLEDSTMLPLVPWELLEAFFHWGDSDWQLQGAEGWYDQDVDASSSGIQKSTAQ